MKAVNTFHYCVNTFLIKYRIRFMLTIMFVETNKSYVMITFLLYINIFV